MPPLYSLSLPSPQNLSNHIPTSPNPSKPTQTSLNLSRPLPTSPHCSQHISTSSSPPASLHLPQPLSISPSLSQPLPQRSPVRYSGRGHGRHADTRGRGLPYIYNGPIQSLCRDIHLCVCVCVCVSVSLFCHLFTVFLLSFTEDKISINQSQKRFLKEKLRKDIGLRFSNLCSEMVQNCHTEKSYFCCLWHLFAWTHNVVCIDA